MNLYRENQVYRFSGENAQRTFIDIVGTTLGKYSEGNIYRVSGEKASHGTAVSQKMCFV